MEISYNRKPDPIYPTFDSLSLTDVFFLVSESGKSNSYPNVYMVIEECFTDDQGNDVINAICLNDGLSIYVSDETKVIPLKASLSISKELVK